VLDENNREFLEQCGIIANNLVRLGKRMDSYLDIVHIENLISEKLEW